jgi:pSer/pThr/pTyr-binding forkhead associated (FHA) protein
MAKLLIKTVGFEGRLIELRLGVNRIGRSPSCEFQITHPTISSLHCELILTDGGVILRDLESTNGTFVGGRQVREARLSDGDTVRLGDVEFFVESTDARVAIPKFLNDELPAPPVVATDGAMMCPRHQSTPATHQCTRCKEVLCERCVHRLRRKGGKITLLLCPVCSASVELIGAPKKAKKKSFLGRLGETVKLKMTRRLH